ncbi:phosphonate metabolism transcriptional regulator PhnF [Labrys wisconsinensis]|uniref:GntR family phosphonate transport system transcriptional regulator n=1 Tax=Labrys wisconsinensis TaxID=425677 RepID=A0ABU0J9U2_9HYPH|nr:phosphonate metabolism transcriptional regulator PhnF [Labrys wisconsinensis]MDQ0471035.1 GntR family phosphonate transport system transcriptional regulator [Labrys wisconsinensis]
MTQNDAHFPWRRVYSTLQTRIVRGVMAQGQQLPAENDLADEFQVHRNTVRRAIERLREQGLIRVQHGVGSFVREQTIVHSLGPQTKLSATLRRINRVETRRVLDSGRVRAGSEIGLALGVPATRFVHRIRMLNLIDDHAAILSNIYFPLPRLDGIGVALEETGSITEALRRCGVPKFTRRESRLSAAMLSQPDAALLEQPRSVPVLSVRNVNVDEEGRPVQFSHSLASSRWVEFVVQFDGVPTG